MVWGCVKRFISHYCSEGELGSRPRFTHWPLGSQSSSRTNQQVLSLQLHPLHRYSTPINSSSPGAVQLPWRRKTAGRYTPCFHYIGRSLSLLVSRDLRTTEQTGEFGNSVWEELIVSALAVGLDAAGKLLAKPAVSSVLRPLRMVNEWTY